MKLDDKSRNIIDYKLIQLEKEGKIPKHMGYEFNQRFGFETKNIMNIDFWEKFVSHLTDEDVDFILSYPQQGNWNAWLYEAAQNRKGILSYAD